MNPHREYWKKRDLATRPWNRGGSNCHECKGWGQIFDPTEEYAPFDVCTGCETQWCVSAAHAYQERHIARRGCQILKEVA